MDLIAAIGGEYLIWAGIVLAIAIPIWIVEDWVTSLLCTVALAVFIVLLF